MLAWTACGKASQQPCPPSPPQTCGLPPPLTDVPPSFPPCSAPFLLFCLPCNTGTNQPTNQQSTTSGSTHPSTMSLASGSVAQVLWALTAATSSTLRTSRIAPPPAPSTTSTTAKTPNTTTTMTQSPALLRECVLHTPCFNTPVSHSCHACLSHACLSLTCASHSRKARHELWDGFIAAHSPTPSLPVCSLCCFPLLTLSLHHTQVASPLPLQDQLRRLHRPAQHPARVGHCWRQVPLQTGHCRRGRPHPRLIRLDRRCARIACAASHVCVFPYSGTHAGTGQWGFNICCLSKPPCLPEVACLPAPPKKVVLVPKNHPPLLTNQIFSLTMTSYPLVMPPCLQVVPCWSTTPQR